MADPAAAVFGAGLVVLLIAALPFILLLVALWRIGTGTQQTAKMLSRMAKQHERAANGLLALDRIADAAVAQMEAESRNVADHGFVAADVPEEEPRFTASAAQWEPQVEEVPSSEPQWEYPVAQGFNRQASNSQWPPARTILVVLGAVAFPVGVVFLFDDNSSSLVTGTIVGGIGLLLMVGGWMVKTAK